MEPARHGASETAGADVAIAGQDAADGRRTAPLRLVLGGLADAPASLPSGFDGLLIHDMFAEQSTPGLISTLAPVDVATAIATHAKRARTVLADLLVDRVVASGDVALHRSDLFPQPRRELALDPRHGFTETIAEAVLGDERSAAAVGRFWGEAIAALAPHGLGGVRLLGLSALPAASRAPLLRALRAAAPSSLLVADTAGIPWEELAGLTGIGLDGVLCSLGWWDWRAGWFQQELELLRQVGPVLALLPAPGSDGADDPARLRRALGFAVAEAIGWIVPQAIATTLDAGKLATIADHTAGLGLPHLLSAPGQPVSTIMRGAADDPRFSRDATLLLLNTLADRPAAFDPASVLPSVGGAFGPFAPVDDTDTAHGQDKLVPGRVVTLPPGALWAFSATRMRNGTPLPLDSQSAVRAGAWARLALEAPTPSVDGGLFPVKRTAGELVEVGIDVIGDGHDTLAVALQWQGPGEALDETAWHETRMRLLGNDRWQAAFPLETRGLHRYRVEAWRDVWGTYTHELAAKHNAGVNTSLEIIEGIGHVRAALKRGNVALAEVLDALESGDADAQRVVLLSDELAALMDAADARPFSVFSAEIPVDAERTGAGFASWYEVFPRSMSDDPKRHGTFRDVERHLPRVRAMGFDVLYFPPIHPIGSTNRKGPNNTLTPGPEDVGSPYAVGTAEGGHDAIHPELGTLADFLHLREAAEVHGLELALDFAIQCSPDHPWLRDHKDWFDWRPDGTIRYAENPPKKYQDIVNVDFYASGSVPDLWLALANVVLFWCEQGIRLFRVDNPHTKPFPFWQWMIAEIRARYPDAVFLAEAFTRPKVMNRLGKVGFSQSYTYFTWRNTKVELTEYLTQLTEDAPRDFFRPHFFVNTPDINPAFLQDTTRGAFLIRAALAATLSGLWGVYNGFELCEGTRLAPGKEEYLDSEKFQIRAWDWNRPGNIVAEITQLNRIRRENPALRSHLGINFLPAANDAVLFFEKTTKDRSNTILVAISLDPHHVQQARIDLPLWKWALPDQASLAAEDLVGGHPFTLTGRTHDITLTPDQPYLIWRAGPAT
ncbi:alpha-1,4-glucan--maltose-1-phosphate maltosyltransferase [Lichenicola sp.]|uniref:alpha-1,4-glucan--maltose-1-phosphate maltosyltransferase n=1 Tax=Lichenicola sp. TaxID=2804529 RepID=UPI003B0089DA